MIVVKCCNNSSNNNGKDIGKNTSKDRVVILY